MIKKPIILLSNLEHHCVSFVWPQDLSCFVGYRFVEHKPRRTTAPLAHRPGNSGDPPPLVEGELERSSDWLDNWQTSYAGGEDPLHMQFRCAPDGSAVVTVVENDGLQERSWRFVPESNGVSVWMTLKTQEPLPGGYLVQQCLRFTSGIGYGFGRTVATVPFLSELLMQALGNANGTLTWTRKEGRWLPFPVPFTRYHTAAGAGVYDDSAGQVDAALIVRESAPRDQAPASYWRSVAPEAKWDTWSAGFYWERTAAISNRHPADCLHATIDFGPLEGGESRTVRGKIYWIEGTKKDLLAAWRPEFDIE